MGTLKASSMREPLKNLKVHFKYKRISKNSSVHFKYKGTSQKCQKSTWMLLLIHGRLVSTRPC